MRFPKCFLPTVQKKINIYSVLSLLLFSGEEWSLNLMFQRCFVNEIHYYKWFDTSNLTFIWMRKSINLFAKKSDPSNINFSDKPIQRSTSCTPPLVDLRRANCHSLRWVITLPKSTHWGLKQRNGLIYMHKLKLWIACKCSNACNFALINTANTHDCQ